MLKYIITYWPNLLAIKLYMTYSLQVLDCAVVPFHQKRNISKKITVNIQPIKPYNVFNYLWAKWSRKGKRHPQVLDFQLLSSAPGNTLGNQKLEERLVSKQLEYYLAHGFIKLNGIWLSPPLGETLASEGTGCSGFCTIWMKGS